MKKITALEYLHQADKDLLTLITMSQRHENGISLLTTSHRIQRAIKTAREILLTHYLEVCLTDVIEYNKKEKLQEWKKAIRYL